MRTPEYRGGRVVLLDLNYTFVANSHEARQAGGPFADVIGRETFRTWLLPLFEGHNVHLVTARPKAHEQKTLQRIGELCEGWMPDAWHFNARNLRPPRWKRLVLENSVFPLYGREVPYLAIESNPATRKMYGAYSIPSCRIRAEDDAEPWGALPAGVVESSSPALF